ncbi:DnaD domain protein [Spiroplasma tabanidicola]|uniref:Chromosome replication initiation and membrane attachment protein n=1 Tax=Spiroplasma tabanidicola TaxID=324079 RepID=A0A6I6CBD0_9MOLU|nr:DnaD domain protein [Spiroplasma tabanidicola]QGS52255.1 chromosome replication initiation and membrane attachment protein [Spiroplasma tabanidicola]
MRNYTYKVVLKNRIDLLDDKVLSYLYQPILGLRSVALYKTLFHEAEVIKELKKTEIYDEKRLLDISLISSDKLTKAIKRLEAMGLVVTLENKAKNSIIFNLYSPLEPKDYFANRLFNAALLDKIGDKNYEIAKLTFKEENDLNDNGYQNTSSKFLEVFEEFNKKIENTICNDFEFRQNKTNVLLKDLNFERIIKKLAENKVYVSKENIKLKEVIEEVYISYSLTEDIIVQALIKAYDAENVDLDIEKFYISISSKYFVHEDTSELKAEFDPELNKKNKTNAKIKEMETIDPITFLELLMGVDNLALEELEIIRSLRREHKLRDGVVNCLLEFSYLKNDSKIVKNYLLKIAKTINERGITNAKETMEYLKLANKKSNPKKPMSSNFHTKLWEEEIKKDTYILEVDENIKIDPTLWGDI